MVPLSYHNCIFLFQSFIVTTARKNNYEVSNDILHKTNTKLTQYHKLSVRMDTYIDFNDSYIFLTATYIFFIS